MSGNIQYSKICLILLGIVCAGALFARMEGIKWPKLHPDEPVIGTWIEQSVHNIYIKDRVYPNGFVALARPFIFASRALLRICERFAYHYGEIDRVRSSRPDGIYFGRWFNVWAGTVLCVVIFLLVSRIARSQWAGLFAASLVGFAQYAVEHSHYAETDMAAILTLAFALWLWVVASDTVSMRWFIAASLASGFAAGTKFTLLVLAPIVLVEAVLFAKQRLTADWLRRAFGFMCLGFLLFVAGFVIANPAVLLDFKWFWAGLVAEKQRVYAETALNLGPLSVTPTVRYLHHFWCLYDYLKTLGYPWLVLLAAGLPCVVLRLGGAWAGFSRRYWAVLFLFPLLYAAYWLFMAPWVRSQEFLLFLPSFAAIAVLPIMILWRANRFWYRAMAFIFVVLAITANGYNGLRVSALFGWKDTRLMAREWLQIRLPLESALAAESYAEAACIDTWKSPLPINKIERYGLAPLVDQGAAYLVRTSGINGRGLRNPLTGELYSAPAEFFRQFLAKSELLCAWAPLPPRGFATFVSPALELYGLKRFTPTTALQITLPQPALIVNSDQNQVGRQTFFPVGHSLGCAMALLIDRLPQTIAVGGPESLDTPVFLVLNTAERAAVINVHGFGMAKKIP
ncbi:MAG: phospholipid carrier-dependent glycosyltransferase, partial [Kiritimatiellia bacterium]|nr:phospholipid carrier-dependent glycosyltransferase [Kiritimatiellia bacterium]